MKNLRLIKQIEVLELCAISKSTLYRMIREKSFAQAVSLTGRRSVAWRESEVIDWLESREQVQLSNEGEVD